MKRKCPRLIISTVLSLLTVITGYAGGWAIVTVEDLPDYFMAGVPASLTFRVRQHGVFLLDGMRPIVRVTTADLEYRAIGTPTGKSGEYTATLTFPQAGDWALQIDSGFMTTSTLLPVKVIRPDSPAPPPLSMIARGERLFVAKGCMGCHRNQDIAVPTILSIGPDLTGKTFPSDYLKKFLADPKGTRGTASPPMIGQMPNLILAEEDISAIVAFINRERPAAISKIVP